MRFYLIGADHEENLGVGYVAAAAVQAGHAVTVRPYNGRGEALSLAEEITAAAPEVVGLSLQFQHRAVDFMLLAELLRDSGYRGHITCGGHLPSLAWQELLRDASAIDSVVRFEAEESVVDLLSAIEFGQPLSEVPGLALRREDGATYCTPHRPLCPSLDEFPAPLRYRPHSVHMGVPFIPVMGGRGCWGSCAFCSITTFYRGAGEKQRGGGAYRRRDVEGLAEEMAHLYHHAGGALFCFHDDNFLLPRPEQSLQRLEALRAALDDRSVGHLGLIGKCRPDSLSPELARALRTLGVIRLYVGVENASAPGLLHLDRKVTADQVQAALAACAAADIFACYNLLLFEPETTLDDVRVNLAFMRDNAHHPANFCRAEPYYGTPLYRALSAQDRLSGDYRSWNYRLNDDRAELLFRVVSAAFRPRNFAEDGVANRSMGLGYSSKILKHFSGGPEATALDEEAVRLTERVVLDSADLLEEALEFASAATLEDHDIIERYTAGLGLRIASADAELTRDMQALNARMELLVEARGGRWCPGDEDGVAREPGARGGARDVVRRVLAGAALGAGVVAGAASVVDPLPADGGAAQDATTVDGASDGGADVMVVDPPPPDAGSPDYMVVDPPPPDAGSPDYMVVDPPPPDAGSPDYMVVDPLPPDAGSADVQPDAAAVDVPPIADPLPPDAGTVGSLVPADDRLRRALSRVTRPYAQRTGDLPMHAPPQVALSVEGAGAERGLRLHGVPRGASVRYEVSAGEVVGDGPSARWRGAAAGEQVRVAVRTSGGVAVVHAILS